MSKSNPTNPFSRDRSVSKINYCKNCWKPFRTTEAQNRKTCRDCLDKKKKERSNYINWNRV